MKSNQEELSGKYIQSEVFRRLEKYDELTALEHFAMFIGKAQILEYALKSLLVRLFGYDWEKIERRTLGWTCRELKDSGLRADFIALLESVTEYRNYIAHEFLVNEAVMRTILEGSSGRLGLKHLEKGTYELEQLILIYEWTDERNAWK